MAAVCSCFGTPEYLQVTVLRILGSRASIYSVYTSICRDSRLKVPTNKLKLILTRRAHGMSTTDLTTVVAW